MFVDLVALIVLESNKEQTNKKASVTKVILICPNIKLIHGGHHIPTQFLHQLMFGMYREKETLGTSQNMQFIHQS